jgi:uncharacterized protein (DUF58 family)
MLALLVTSGLTSRWNLRRLEIALDPPGEIYARRPVLVGFSVVNRSRLLPRWLVLVGLSVGGPWRLVGYLAPGERARGSLEVLFPRRGHHRLPAAHVASLFPLGLFRKGLRYRLDAELLVYPELFAAGEVDLQYASQSGDRSAPRSGWGHELHALRGFRPGDDPRSIHWKKSAQTGQLVFKEREAEETLRLSILLDNGIGARDAADREGFEQLVSEAATAAWDYLERGFEVELVTRDGRIPFGSGTRQREVILTELALVEPVEPVIAPLVAADSGARQLRLGFAGDDLEPGAPA